VKGFIDLVFEYEGRVYFGDWKSSLLTVDQAADLRGYVDTHFHWQLVVYTVAMVRLLGIRDEAAYARRFGGCLYVFLREMERTREGCAARGVDFQRPDWAQVRAWERELLDHSYGSSPSHKVGH
jgi:exodeoxyribonuclease V beta subunit